ncbi:hypothetical protein B0O99DRAFT_634796 [Bisporella sp. PMI_857]|nr:hypothetical protein B0O99DRAFT_634796 [Bisporella sp. PMI_857]
MELIFESQRRLLLDGTNIPAHIRKRFMENSKLARDNDPYVSWTRNHRMGLFPNTLALLFRNWRMTWLRK